MRSPTSCSASTCRLLAWLLFATPWASRAAEAKFYSSPGKYPLEPGIVLTIEQTALAKDPTCTLTFTTGGAGVTMEAAHPDDPFRAYWDADARVLWWATPRSLGYLAWVGPYASNHHSFRSNSHPRAAPIMDSDQFPACPVAFTAEIERALPITP